MRRTQVAIIFLAIFIFAFSPSADAQFNYSGTLNLTGTGADGILNGTGDWYNTGPNTQIDWTVSWAGSGLVHYAYTFTVDHHDISHISFELSNSFTSSDISNLYINGISSSAYSIGNFTGGNAPYNTMPGNMYGIKFDFASGTTTGTIAFDSTRMPEWGDFYARCGVQVQHELDKNDPNWKEWNSAWNSGYASGETSGAGNDPIFATSSGSYQNHILVPNTVVPEPVSSILFVVGGALLAGRLFVKRKK